MKALRVESEGNQRARRKHQAPRWINERSITAGEWQQAVSRAATVASRNIDVVLNGKILVPQPRFELYKFKFREINP
eukprot:5203794-Pleurochrysis_carterae.AAC.1